MSDILDDLRRYHMVGVPATQLMREAADEIARLRETVERLQRANATRPDYDLNCDRCGRAHILDTSIPSKIWNEIAPDGGVLCTTCIDDLMMAHGLVCEAEFYFVGKALTSKLYTEVPPPLTSPQDSGAA